MNDHRPLPSTDSVRVPDGAHGWHRILDRDELAEQRAVDRDQNRPPPDRPRGDR